MNWWHPKAKIAASQPQRYSVLVSLQHSGCLRSKSVVAADGSRVVASYPCSYGQDAAASFGVAVKGSMAVVASVYREAPRELCPRECLAVSECPTIVLRREDGVDAQLDDSALAMTGRSWLLGCRDIPGT